MSFSRLERTAGPECPNCGCTDAHAIGTTERWGRTSTRYRCNHCRSTWSVREPWGPPPPAAQGPPPEPSRPAGHAEPVEAQPPADGVAFVPTRCPECGSAETRVTKTRRPVRYHRCNDCGASFKSTER